ncbi:Hypothetical protein PFR_JS9-2_2043 [Propionibacterium freudenreichii]|nr:Hypothetical protein PFR_JS9-1_2045 [Propionibacterium freudenreichii]SCQ70636.1 Hypothetical protein PFR_JS9-2_2043 [Propionibacterium freudenreichii]
MRGAPWIAFGSPPDSGLTPAYAGSTACVPWIGGPARGSPPHMRGAHRGGDPLPCVGGLTPAYAGSTPSHQGRPGQWRAHPRICGEHSRRLVDGEHRQGSPPHMRGALSQVVGCLIKRGLTPAYAGSTPPKLLRRSASRAHPRICGEHLTRREPLRESCGSPPHMRGALARTDRRHTVGGLTPAYAGSTWCADPCRRLGRAHPRICGEHMAQLLPDIAEKGSPPHMRGALKAVVDWFKNSGLTPAYAALRS